MDCSSLRRKLDPSCISHEFGACGDGDAMMASCAANTKHESARGTEGAGTGCRRKEEGEWGRQGKTSGM